MEEWWSECVQVKEWLSGMEEALISQKPLAASLDLTEEQKRATEVSWSFIMVTINLRSFDSSGSNISSLCVP